MANYRPPKPQSASIGFFRFHGLGMTRILPRLYLSGEDVVKNKRLLKEHNITHILNLTTNVENWFQPEIVYKRIRVNDVANQDMSECFEEAFEFIDKALSSTSSETSENSVLVHCNAGVSRSASVVIGYLMKTGYRDSFTQAYEFVRAYRPAIAPNPGFIQQLKELEIKLKKLKA